MYKVYGPLPIGFEIEHGILKGYKVVATRALVEDGRLFNIIATLNSLSSVFSVIEVEVIDMPKVGTPL